MKTIILFYILLIETSLFGISKEGLFEKYPNKYFVETGSYLGDGINQALLSKCYEKIYSIELSEQYFEHCTDRFSNVDNVTILFGDSSVELSDVLKQIDAPATFWLDGHWSGGDTAKGVTMSPIIKELKLIKEHPIKTHTILIDDVRLFGTIEFDYVTLDDIIKILLEINPDYEIFFEDGYVEKDILVATIDSNTIQLK